MRLVSCCSPVSECCRLLLLAGIGVADLRSPSITSRALTARLAQVVKTGLIIQGIWAQLGIRAGRRRSRPVRPPGGARRTRSSRSLLSRAHARAHIARHALLDAEEGLAITRGAEEPQIGLREALVLAHELRRKRDVLDRLRRAQLPERERLLAAGGPNRVHRGARHLVEAFRAPGAHVEDARELGMVEEEEIHANHVLDRDEVADLLTGPVAGAAFEEANPPLGEVLVEEMECDRRHAALVRLARAVHVEVAEARDLRGLRRQAAAHRLVEEELGIAVQLERGLVLSAF